MIVTKKKDSEGIFNLVKDFKRIIIIGCGDCATLCNTGGINEVDELRQILTKKGKDIVYTSVIDTACDQRLVKLELRKFPKDYDCIISLSCGSGTQAISDLVSKPVFPGNDTMHIGVTKRIGSFEQMCSSCGECIVGEYAGICPITRCTKSLLNGPCGGSYEGKCEIDNKKDCAWQLIFDKLKEQNRLYLLEQFHEPKKWNKK